jgi:ethanolamine utilization protein EutJ
LAHPRLQKAAALCNQTPAASESPLWLGVDLGTCDVVSMVVDSEGQPVAVCLDWADVVRDGIVWDFFGAVTIVRRHLDTLEQQLGCRFSHGDLVSAGHRPAYFDQRTRICRAGS